MFSTRNFKTYNVLLRVIEFDSSTNLNLKEVRSWRFKIQVLTIKKIK